MNNVQRRQIKNAVDQFDRIVRGIEGLRDILVKISDNEREAYENSPENLKFSEEKSQMLYAWQGISTGIDLVDEAAAKLTEAKECIAEEYFSHIIRRFRKGRQGKRTNDLFDDIDDMIREMLIWAELFSMQLPPEIQEIELDT